MSRQNDTITSEEELIARAKDIFGTVEYSVFFQGRDFTLLDALETFYMNGFPDDVTGDVDSPNGHVYRVARWIVRTDDRGFKNVEAHDTEAEAIHQMIRENDEYSLWAGDDE